MKFKMKKEVLLQAIDRMKAIATRGIKPEFTAASRVTIEAFADKVSFITSNGHLDAKLEITDTMDNNVVGSSKGKTTVEVAILRDILANLGGKDSNSHVIALESTDSLLKMVDTNSDSKSKKKIEVEMQTFTEHHSVDVSRPTAEFTHTFDISSFIQSVDSVVPFANPTAYKLRYQMICLHFLENETRFVGGDGMRFAVLITQDKNKSITNADGQKYIIPQDQASIISYVLRGYKHVDLVFRDAQYCYIGAHGGIEMVLKGIPLEKYIAYEAHAFKTDKAQNICDVNRAELESGMRLLSSLRDKEMEKQVRGSCLSVNFDLESRESEIQELVLRVQDGKYRGKCEVDCNFYSLGDRKTFKSKYGAKFLTETASAAETSTIRFYCIDEDGTLIAEPVELDDKAANSHGVPNIKLADGSSRMVFFFASAPSLNGQTDNQ